MSSLKVIYGIGNNYPEYHNTRHNAGFIFLDVLYKYLELNCKCTKKELLTNNFIIYRNQG